MGAGRRFREADPAIVLASVQPDSPWHGLEGLKHMATAIVPAIYDPTLADVALTVKTERALTHVRHLARDEGRYVGPSSGAALDGALQIADGLRHGVIVTVFPDGGDRYGSEAWWEEDRPALVGVEPAASAAIRAHAVETYPHECCGALIGAADRSIESAVRLDNVTTSDREHRFLVSPDAYRRAEREADATGRVLLGFYHSHPDHPAEPSAFDLAHAWPSLSYIIVSVQAGTVADVRSWRLRADRSAFDAEPLAPRW